MQGRRQQGGGKRKPAINKARGDVIVTVVVIFFLVARPIACGAIWNFVLSFGCCEAGEHPQPQDKLQAKGFGMVPQWLYYGSTLAVLGKDDCCSQCLRLFSWEWKGLFEHWECNQTAVLWRGRSVISLRQNSDIRILASNWTQGCKGRFACLLHVA